MEKMVHQYLSNYFYINASDIGNDGIYYINDIRITPVPYDGRKLVADIITVFGLDENLVKTFINNWAISKKQNVNLEFYWISLDDLISLPLAMQVFPNTIANELIPVKPIKRHNLKFGN
jgi:hypothetical protein